MVPFSILVIIYKLFVLVLVLTQCPIHALVTNSLSYDLSTNVIPGNPPSRSTLKQCIETR